MSEELTLLPCPFCGSRDVEVQGKPAILDALDSVCCNECTADAPYPAWNTRAQSSQGGEAVEVVEVIAMYDKNAASSADAFRWPSMVQGQSWREPVMTVAQHQRILAASVGSAEPVAYAAFADNGNIRMWCRSAIGMCELIDEHGNKAVPLYTHPAAPECGCCGQTGECDDDCDSRILYLAGTPSCPAWM